MLPEFFDLPLLTFSHLLLLLQLLLHQMILFLEVFRIPLLILINRYVLRFRLIELGLCEVQLLPELSEILLYLLLHEHLLAPHRLQLISQPSGLVLPPPRLLLSPKEFLSGGREGEI